jgi:hypothetical protein
MQRDQLVEEALAGTRGPHHKLVVRERRQELRNDLRGM